MENKPFVFGGISANSDPTGKKPRSKLKKKKIIPIFVEMDSSIDAYNCKDRIVGSRFLCSNEKCICKYKNILLEDIKLDINKSIILKNLSKIVVSDYVFNLLRLEWKSSKLKGKFGIMVYDFIKQCKEAFDLDMLIDPKMPGKVNTAFEAYNCKDRKPHYFFFCRGCKLLNEYGKELTCHCHYCDYTEEQVNIEVLREWFNKVLAKEKLTMWERIILSFNWAGVKGKRADMVNNFIKKYSKLFPQLKNKTVPKQNKP